MFSTSTADQSARAEYGRVERRREIRRADYQRHAERRREARRVKYALEKEECGVCRILVSKGNKKAHEKSQRHQYLVEKRASEECSDMCRLCRVLGLTDVEGQIENGQDLAFDSEDDDDQLCYRSEGGEALARRRGYRHEFEYPPQQQQQRLTEDDFKLEISDLSSDDDDA